MIKLSKISTRAPKGLDKSEIKKETDKIAEKIGELSRIFEADRRHSLLIVFQGMDGSGKDGSTRETFRFVSPAIASAHSFKKPTDEEMAHDFLWRAHKLVPAKGQIKIFNRSHYEDVLIQKVHNWIDKERVSKRIEAINNFEELLVFDNNTTILKFYLHLSPERQQEKLQERIDLLRKNWKHNPNDMKESKLWNEYRIAYEDVINKSTIPWNIVPADQRWYRNYFIAKIVLETMKNMNLEYPTL
jgi:PPK2 family polyphosphate:nucleotide phosphotransferase